MHTTKNILTVLGCWVVGSMLGVGFSLLFSVTVDPDPVIAFFVGMILGCAGSLGGLIIGYIKAGWL